MESEQNLANLSPDASEPMVSEITFGMKLVGIDFNPSGDFRVIEAKRICAQLADMLYNNHKGEEASDLYDQLYHHAIGEILNCQMNVVKLLTLKY